MTRTVASGLALAFCGLMAGCATPLSDLPARIDSLLPVDIVLLGEQHDAPDHQRLQRAVVLELARRQQLAAVAMEMAEQGRSTAGLARDATDAQAQAALHWNDGAWSWSAYGPVVMAAVRNGVPVLGANLPRDAMRAAMANTTLDTHLAPGGLDQQHANMRAGHCQLMPESQVAPMARIQIARDAAMAHTAMAATQPGKSVLLVAGGEHVSRALGVPTHLPASVRARTILAVAGRPDATAASSADLLWETPELPPRDHCAGLEQRLKK